VAAANVRFPPKAAFDGFRPIAGITRFVTLGRQLSCVKGTAPVDGEIGERRLSGWWALIAVAVGLVVAILAGQVVSDGEAEIAGVMAATLTLGVRAFWAYRVKVWFAPLVAGWIAVHLSALVLLMPMKIVASKLLLQLAWLEYLGFVGLVWLTNKMWKKRANR
jgi:hypothetical protein